MPALRVLGPLLLRRRNRDGSLAPSAAPGGTVHYGALTLALAAGVLVAAATMHRSGQWGG